MGWLDVAFHHEFREEVLHVAAREGLACPVYCLMPDHIHLVWMGLRRDSDQIKGMAFFRTHLESKLEGEKFQHQAHDHVLREDERKQSAFENACGYVVENPLRAGLVEDPNEWEFTGTVVPGYPTLHPLRDQFWDRFWRIYFKLREPDAGGLARPPIP